ncbi:DsbA family oxidoreductase [Actibacterium ureilyticum]|uniref:DsbA family oxidoreductase n=1 Tax=Actibacterium ureilyticum TaxID=1590614 RepID=UPI000BAAA850|nr:DsbA family oxidoreductase [Actibacterium ureilyticum]
MVKLDILSDPICPWCYIGKTRLDRALAQRPDHPFTIEWHPFQLNPDMPPEGMDRRAYLEGKFGGKEGAVRVYGQIADAAEEDGLMLNLGAIERTPNTLNAHRLIHWAGIEGRQTPVVSALFAAYFEKGLDISDLEVLLQIATDAEMDVDATRRLLQGDADSADIRARDAHARQRGVGGVPMFIVANQHALSGAQPTDLWLQAIDEITEQIRTKTPTDSTVH